MIVTPDQSGDYGLPNHVLAYHQTGQGRGVTYVATCACGKRLRSDYANDHKFRLAWWHEHVIEALVIEMAELRAELAAHIGRTDPPS